MRKALQIAKGVVKTDPYTDILDAIRKAREGLRKVDDSAGKGDQNGVDEGLKAIQQAKDRLKKLVRDEARKSDDPKIKVRFFLLFCLYVVLFVCFVLFCLFAYFVLFVEIRNWLEMKI
jgi:hypothetical protein